MKTSRLESYRKYGAKRRQNPEYRKAQAQRYAEWLEKHKNDPEYKARKAAQMRTYRNDPELRMRHEARWQANRAVKAGRIQRKPCERCGNRRTQMHHADYYKPLEVTWLCTPCHRIEHAKATTTKGENDK